MAASDRLVLVVGPAGAGKTTMLAAAVDDLTDQRRVVFGVAPTAKAARVLESETAMDSDTVAKLLHECRRTDRPPERPWRLPVGATVIVDEAGARAGSTNSWPSNSRSSSTTTLDPDTSN